MQGNDLPWLPRVQSQWSGERAVIFDTVAVRRLFGATIIIIRDGGEPEGLIM